MGGSRQRSGWALALAFWLVAGCAMAPVAPLTTGAHGYADSDDEKTLLRRAGQLDAELRGKGLVLPDEEIGAYVRAVGERLVPPPAAAAVRFRFAVIRDSVVNAFALPDGNIYLTVGLLARLEDETQLAQVLSHEIAHVVQRHGLQQHRNRKATIIAAHIADLALFGTSIAYLPAIGSLASHSRESELEADRLALEYMARVGYPVSGAERLFAVLQEVKEKESVWGSVYSSHPDNQHRAQHTRELIESRRATAHDRAPGPQPSAFPAVRDRLVLENIKLKLNVKQYALALDSADRALARQGASPWLHYHRGEALRLMAEEPQAAAREHAWIHDKRYNDELVAEFRGRRQTLLSSAKEAYRRALAIDQGFAHAYRGIGLVAYAEDDRAAAREALSFYLANGQEISDKRYIDHILGRLGAP